MYSFTKLNHFMEQLPTSFDIPGAGIIIHHKGKEVFRQFVGFADTEAKTPMEATSLYRLYSMSKPITVVAALQLLEKGVYLLNDPIARYLPAYWNAKMFTEDGNIVPVSRPITVMDLMTMRSGLTYCGNSNPTECATTDVVNRLIQRTDFSYTTREFADALAEVPVLFAPGSHWQYAYNIDVLGALIEVWSGQALEEYMQEHIFRPLHMNSTTFHPDESQKKHLVSMYEYNYETRSRKKILREEQMPLYGGTVCEHGGHGLFSTISDYSLFAQMLANHGFAADGTSILSENTINLMRRNHLEAAQLADEHAWEQLAGYGYGYGVRTMIAPEQGGSNSPIGEFGWSGLGGCYLLVDPENELSVVYTQCMTPNREQEIHPRLRNIIYGCLLLPVKA